MLPRTVMEWTKQHDKALLGEMTISDLFQYKKGTPERGQLWDSIAGNLNAMDYPKFKVAKRSCRDRWTLLRTKYKRRMSEEIQATGIDAEVGELDEIIEDLIGKEDAAIDSDKEGKKKAEADKKAAEEIRIKAMERFGNTSKRGGEDGEEGAKKKKRRSGSDAVEFLREKKSKSKKKSKVKTFSERGRDAVKERSTKPNTVDITATTADESSIAHPHGKNVA